MLSKKWLLLIVVLLFGLGACGGDDESGAGQPDELSADAGEDFTLEVGSRPTFNGCSSTGSIENYKWTILQAPEAKAADVGKVIREIEPNCEFTLEDAMVIEEVGEWVIQLEVRDEGGSTDEDTVTVAVVSQ